MTPNMGLVVVEGYVSGGFDVVLDTQPTDDVTINLSIIQGADVVFFWDAPDASLTFTTLNWATHKLWSSAPSTIPMAPMISSRSTCCPP